MEFINITIMKQLISLTEILTFILPPPPLPPLLPPPLPLPPDQSKQYIQCQHQM